MDIGYYRDISILVLAFLYLAATIVLTYLGFLLWTSLRKFSGTVRKARSRIEHRIGMDLWPLVELAAALASVGAYVYLAAKKQRNAKRKKNQT